MGALDVDVKVVVGGALITVVAIDGLIATANTCLCVIASGPVWLVTEQLSDNRLFNFLNECKNSRISGCTT